MTGACDHDAIILGGGLAGLTLALQLRKAWPDMDILVLERQQHPLPAARHKVGESTVEIGAHYLAEELGLGEHLQQAHLRKFGLRFFFSHGRDALDAVTELGVTRFLPVPSYQVDRGILENFLGEEALRRGIAFLHGSRVVRTQLGEADAPHQVCYEQDGCRHEVRARWLLDASGRAGLLRRKLDLTRDNGHAAHAVWFRIDARIEIDRLVDDPGWRAQCTPPDRWLSTNHLMGPGYWAWLIPLGSGAHSVGIVFDAAMHDSSELADFDRVMHWLERNQPALCRALAPQRDKLLDFRVLRHYSHSASQVFSADRWALTGEAGTFLDPFYSPGTDFIAIANSYITALVGLDRAARPLAPYVQIYQDLFLSLYDNTLSLFRGQYPMFGNAEVMTQKITWDYSYYWAVLCQLVFQHRLTDMNLLGAVREDLARAAELNRRMQKLFRDWHAHAAASGGTRAGLVDQGTLDWFADLNGDLHTPLDGDALKQRLKSNLDLLEGLADAMVTRAARSDPALAAPLTGKPQPPLLDAA